MGFEELGLDARLVRAMAKRGLCNPTPIQLKISSILKGKNVVATAKTGSGKTLAYLLPLLHKLLAQNDNDLLSSLILVPTRELCQQVYEELESLLSFCSRDLRPLQLTSNMSPLVLRAAMSRRPNIVVSTPGCAASCLADGIILASSLQALSSLVLDEVDLLLSYGYESDLKELALHIPPRCQFILMSATSANLEKLNNFVIHDLEYLTPLEVEDSPHTCVVPSTVQQFMISCKPQDKLLHLLTLIRFDLIMRKALIFVNKIDTSFRLKLFLEQFGLKSAVLNAELPQNSRLHILKEFNIGLFDYMIATDDGKSDRLHPQNEKRKKKLKKNMLDAEFGVVRGVDFKNVSTVVNYDLPSTVSGYIHRIGRTGRAGNVGAAVSLVSENDEELITSIEDFLSSDKENATVTRQILPFPTPTKTAVESLRYRAEDVARSVTKLSIREARAKELRMEILNSERLKAHFEDNPADLKLLKHDKSLSKKQAPEHLRGKIPDYLRDPEVEAAVKVAIGGKPSLKFIKKRKRSREDDPLKSIGRRAKRGATWLRKS